MPKSGNVAKLYYDTDGITGAGAAFVELDLVESDDLSDSRKTGDVEDRSSDFVRKVAGTREVGISFTATHKQGHAGLTAFRTAHDAGSVIGVRALDSEDGEGVEFDAIVTQYNITKPLSGAQKVSIEVAPHAGSTNEPARVAAAA